MSRKAVGSHLISHISDSFDIELCPSGWGLLDAGTAFKGASDFPKRPVGMELQFSVDRRSDNPAAEYFILSKI